jgi:hypothetical protein
MDVEQILQKLTQQLLKQGWTIKDDQKKKEKDKDNG